MFEYEVELSSTLSDLLPQLRENFSVERNARLTVGNSNGIIFESNTTMGEIRDTFKTKPYRLYVYVDETETCGSEVVESRRSRSPSIQRISRKTFLQGQRSKSPSGLTANSVRHSASSKNTQRPEYNFKSCKSMHKALSTCDDIMVLYNTWVTDHFLTPIVWMN